MSLRKLLWASVAGMMLAGTVVADPVRTVFTRENKFPQAMGWEVSMSGGGSTYEDDNAPDRDTFYLAPGVRFGITERLAARAEIPFHWVTISDRFAGDRDESGIGDMSLGIDFLFFEDIFRYAWILPHAAVTFPTGDDDKDLGLGKTQAKGGVSIGTTVHDVLHFAADISFVSNGSMAEKGEDVVMGSLSLVWDLDERASLLGEVQARDDSSDPDDSYVLRGHLGMSYRINRHFSLMGYGGTSSSGFSEDFYGMGRLVYQF